MTPLVRLACCLLLFVAPSRCARVAVAEHEFQKESAEDAAEREFCQEAPLPFLGLRLCLRLESVAQVGSSRQVDGALRRANTLLALLPNLWLHVELVGCDGAQGCTKPSSFRQKLYSIEAQKLLSHSGAALAKTGLVPEVLSASNLASLKCIDFSKIPAAAEFSSGTLAAVNNLMGGTLADAFIGKYCIAYSESLDEVTGKMASCINHYYSLGLSRPVLRLIASMARLTQEDSTVAFLDNLAATPDVPPPGHHLVCMPGDGSAGDGLSKLVPGSSVPEALAPEESPVSAQLAARPACSAFFVPTQHCGVCKQYMRSFLWRVDKLECSSGTSLAGLLEQAAVRLQLTPIDGGKEYRLCAMRGDEVQDCNDNLVNIWRAVSLAHEPTWLESLKQMTTGTSKQEAYEEEAQKFLATLLQRTSTGRLLHEVAMDRLVELWEALRPCQLSRGERKKQVLTQLCHEMSCGCPSSQALDAAGQCVRPRGPGEAQDHGCEAAAA